MKTIGALALILLTAASCRDSEQAVAASSDTVVVQEELGFPMLSGTR